MAKSTTDAEDPAELIARIGVKQHIAREWLDMVDQGICTQHEAELGIADLGLSIAELGDLVVYSYQRIQKYYPEILPTVNAIIDIASAEAGSNDEKYFEILSKGMDMLMAHTLELGKGPLQ